MNKQFIFTVNVLVNAESLQDAQQYLEWDLNDGRNTTSHNIVESKEMTLESIKPMMGMEHIDPIMAGLLQPFAPAPSEAAIPIEKWGVAFEALKQQGDIAPKPAKEFLFFTGAKGIQAVKERIAQEAINLTVPNEAGSEQPWMSLKDSNARFLFNACKKIRNNMRFFITSNEHDALELFGEDAALVEYDRIIQLNDLSNKGSWYASEEAKAKQELTEVAEKVFSIPTAYAAQQDPNSDPKIGYPNMATVGKEVIYELKVDGYLVKWTGLDDSEWMNIHSKSSANSRRTDKNGDTWELDWLTGIAVNIGKPL